MSSQFPPETAFEVLNAPNAHLEFPGLRLWLAGSGSLCQQSARFVRGANRLIKEGLKKAGWGEEELVGRRKGDPKKVKIALRLRRETTMTLAWIAQRLNMGTKTHLTHLLYWQKRNP